MEGDVVDDPRVSLLSAVKEQLEELGMSVDLHSRADGSSERSKRGWVLSLTLTKL